MSGVSSDDKGKAKATSTQDDEFKYICYGTEKESPYLPAIRQLISKDLSEPYSIYVYRYFLYQWGELCFMVRDTNQNTYSLLTMLGT